MENAQYKVHFNGAILYFDGCDLIDVEYEENLNDAEFQADWFIDESGQRIDIEVDEGERHPYDGSDSPLYADIKIQGRTVKKLEIYTYADGTLYLEPKDDFYR